MWSYNWSIRHRKYFNLWFYRFNSIRFFDMIVGSVSFIITSFISQLAIHLSKLTGCMGAPHLPKCGAVIQEHDVTSCSNIIHELSLCEYIKAYGSSTFDGMWSLPLHFNNRKSPMIINAWKPVIKEPFISTCHIYTTFVNIPKSWFVDVFNKYIQWS